MAAVVVDDHLLLRVLLDDEPPELRPGGGRLWTTGLWYHRLCRAVAVPAVTGSLSRSLGAVDPAVALATTSTIISLPVAVGLLSMRELAWPMAALLADGVRLNLLSLEALAAAEHLDAELCIAVADANPALLAAAEERNLPVRLVG